MRVTLGLEVLLRGCLFDGKKLGLVTRPFAQTGLPDHQAALEKAFAWARDSRATIILTQNADKSPEQASFVRTFVSHEPGAILVATRDPYDILLVPEIGTYNLYLQSEARSHGSPSPGPSGKARRFGKTSGNHTCANVGRTRLQGPGLTASSI